MTEIPVLITYDVHITNYPLEEIRRALYEVLKEQARISSTATLFFPAEAARLLKAEVRELASAGHEIGCHGLTHRSGELYDRLGADDQMDRLRRATAELEDVVGGPVRAFRAPAFRISAATFRALDELGYDADLSINSQRLGLLSSDPWNFAWLIAPRTPYHPDGYSTWRSGRLRLWEIPLSCFILPFMSKTLMIFGLAMMHWFFRGLLAESSVTRKPIVFMTHPEELLADLNTLPRQPFRWRHLLPSEYGFEFRHALLERDPRAVVRMSRDLFDHMRSVDRIAYLTVRDYVRRLNKASAE